MPTTEPQEAIASAVVEAAFQVHRTVGPGLLESAYHRCMLLELRAMGLTVVENVPVSMMYREQDVGIGYRMDLVIENVVLVELKAIPKTMPVHEAQLLTYLKLSGLPLGFLINFHSPLLKDGLKRMING